MIDFDVLIPAHGEHPCQIEHLLSAVFVQDSDTFRLNKLLLCSDNTYLQHCFANRSSIEFVSQEPKRGKPNAFNSLLDHTQSVFCIQNSADCIPARQDTYDNLLKPLLDTRIGVVTSQPIPMNKGFLYLPNIIWKIHHLVQPKVSGELFAFKRHAVSYLPEDVVHDDAYIHAYANSHNFHVVYAPNAIVLNAVPETFSEYYAQRKKNVIGSIQLGDEFGIFPPKGMRLRTLVLMSLELLANVHGRLDYLRGKIPKGLIGYNLESTKEVRR